MRSFFSHTVPFALMLAGIALAGGCHPGGCPWTQVSAVTTQPATSCLAIHVENATGSGSFGGCVSPDLSITNACPTALVLTGTNVRLLGADGTPVAASGATIAAGTTAVIEIDLTSTSNQEDVPATLGTQAVTLSFTTSG